VSIILAGEAPKTDQGVACESALDPNLRGLLDHIAVELAEEYIRLMEATAETDSGRPAADSDLPEGDAQ
jgi:hypothetical protein